MADASDADFFKYLKVWSSIKDINKAIGDYKELYTSFQDGKEALRKLKESGGEIVDEAILGKEAFNNLLMTGDKYKDLIQGGIGNVQTSYDLGGKVMDYLSTHPDAKSVSLQVQSDGTIAVQAGGSESVVMNDRGIPMSDLQDNQKLQELSGLMNQMYSDAEVQLAPPDAQQAGQPVSGGQPALVQPPVLVQPLSVVEPPVLVLPPVTVLPVPAQPTAVIQPQTQPVSPSQPASSPASVPVVEKPSYNGTYTGSSNAAVGVASGSVGVIGEDLSGRVTYRESAQGKTFTIGLNVYGSANGDGKVSGRFSGSQTFGGSKVTVSGSFSGGIYDNVMSLRFSGNSSATGGVSGSIKLYR
jgi:hypothetical protein